MKASELIISALAALLCAGACSPLSLDGTPEGLQMQFTGMSEGLPTSRTTLGSDRSIIWSTSDKVSLFASTGSAGSVFSVSSTEAGGTIATFSGLSAASANGYYYALYPASPSARLVATSGTVNASLPTVQTGVENSFAGDASLALARVDAEAGADNQILHFKNVCALLSFTVPGNYITRVRISSRDGSTAMTGPANIRYNDGEPAASPTSASKNYVEVNVPSGSMGKTYYAVVYPGVYASGFEVSFYNSGNAFNKYSSTLPLELKRNGNVSLIRKNWGADDDRSSKSRSGTELIAPVISSGAQTSPSSASISFSCASGKRDCYKFYIRDASSLGDGTPAGTLETGSGKYGSYSYTFSGLSAGAAYDLGVSASCTEDPGYTDSPVTWFEDLSINAAVSGMSVEVESTAENYYNLIVNYSISGLSGSGAEHGLVFSYTDPSPTCGSVGAAGKLPGPVLNSTGSVKVSQCVPNAPLKESGLCYIRAYCFDDNSGNYVYSPVQQLRLGVQPSGLGISKTALDSPSSAIELFSFTAGDTYKGYCAKADCTKSSPVRLGVNNVPMGKSSDISMASQLSSSVALVLVNGQIFGGQGNIGLAFTGGTLRYNNSSDDGISACSSYGNSYSSWQPVTRAVIGADADGEPGAYWCSLTDGSPLFFSRPLPAGTAVYPQVSALSGPGPSQSWKPSEALSTGPMLLYEGKVCVSEDKIATGIYYTNYELWETTAGNIYGSSRQRTAVGYNSVSREFYLVAVTSNVNLTTLARIMKGLGCDFAMNLDGGASTQMQVAGKGALTANSRAVKSTIGFFNR